MADGPIRDPAQIRADRARKLKPIETGHIFAAVLAALIDEDWTTPKIEELFITSDRCILARPTGEVTHNLFIGEGVRPVKPSLRARCDSEDVGKFVDSRFGIDATPSEREPIHAVDDQGGPVQVEGSPGVESLSES